VWHILSALVPDLRHRLSYSPGDALIASLHLTFAQSCFPSLSEDTHLNVSVIMFPTPIFLEFVISTDLQSSSSMFFFSIILRGLVVLLHVEA
jgi:hypothetical protein